MTAMTLDGHFRRPVAIDVCPACQCFWFDKYENLRLSPGSTLRLMKFIGEHASSRRALADILRCPRCRSRLRRTQDMQRSTRFHYWRCVEDHGRFITFFEFLREKDFLRPLSPRQLRELRRHIQTVSCSNCGAPIDLAAASACAHCGSVLSMLDMKQPQQMLARLRQAAGPRPIDSAFSFERGQAGSDVESPAGPFESGAQSWRETSASGLVEAGLSALSEWLNKSGF